MKIANSIAKTAELKTMAVTKVEVDAVCAVVALTPDLTVELVVEKKNKGGKRHVHGGWQERRKELLNAAEWVYIEGNLF